MEKKIAEIAEKLQDEETKLEEAVGTYMLLLADLEIDGYQDKENIDKQKAELFVYRFPAYIPALQLIGRDLTERQAAINDITRMLENVKKVH